jgi:hypothetical protein
VRSQQHPARIARRVGCNALGEVADTNDGNAALTFALSLPETLACIVGFLLRGNEHTAYHPSKVRRFAYQ